MYPVYRIYLFILAIYEYALYGGPLLKAIPAIITAFIPQIKRPSGYISIALLCSAIGDYFLDFSDVENIILGIVFFSFCHILIIIVISSHSYALWVNPYLIGLSLFSIFLYPILGYLTFIIAIYASILSVALTMSWRISKRTLFLGCLLFVISDILVLLEMVLKRMNSEYQNILPQISLPMYWTSLLSIALSTYD